MNPRRININLKLNDDLLELVRKLNNVVVETGNEDISFQPGSPHIPHVTLLMGEVNDGNDYHNLVLCCNEFAKTFQPFEYNISLPYLKMPSQHFIFIDTLNQDYFRSLRRCLHETAGEFLECSHHGGPDNLSHITIGYANSIFSDLNKLIELFYKVKGHAFELQISDAGKRGTCVSVLESIKLGI